MDPLVTSIIGGLIVTAFVALVRPLRNRLLKPVATVVGGAASWMKPAGLARRGLSLAVGESAYIASHPHTPDRNLKDIVVQVLIGNGTRDEITVAAPSRRRIIGTLRSPLPLMMPMSDGSAFACSKVRQYRLRKQRTPSASWSRCWLMVRS